MIDIVLLWPGVFIAIVCLKNDQYGVYLQHLLIEGGVFYVAGKAMFKQIINGFEYCLRMKADLVRGTIQRHQKRPVWRSRCSCLGLYHT